jgi:voltage-gated potassium channel
MTPLRDLTPSRRRRLIATALLRALASTAVIVALYYLLPLDDLSTATSVLILTLGLIGVVVIIGWEVWIIAKSPYPGIQAIEALAVILPLFLLLFSTTYFLMEHTSAGNFSQPLSRTDALYFTVTTFTTVGYGDITARSQGARLVVIGQMITDLAVIGFGVKVLFGAVNMRRGATLTSGVDPGAMPGPDHPQ